MSSVMHDILLLFSFFFVSHIHHMPDMTLLPNILASSILCAPRKDLSFQLLPTKSMEQSPLEKLLVITSLSFVKAERHFCVNISNPPDLH
jgi:hypothetical protein